MQNSDSNIVKGNHAEEKDLRTFLDGSVRSTVLLRSCAVGLGTYNPV